MKQKTKKHTFSLVKIPYQKFLFFLSFMNTFSGGDYMIPVSRDEILSRFAGIRQCCKLFINYILLLHGKMFHPGKTGSLFCTAAILLCWEAIFPRNRFSPSRRDKKVN